MWWLCVLLQLQVGCSGDSIAPFYRFFPTCRRLWRFLTGARSVKDVVVDICRIRFVLGSLLFLRVEPVVFVVGGCLVRCENLAAITNDNLIHEEVTEEVVA